MSEDKAKALNLMKFWLFGTFVIVWTAITLYIGLFTDKDWWLAVRTGFPIWGITGVLCIAFFFGYQAWVNKKAE